MKQNKYFITGADLASMNLVLRPGKTDLSGKKFVTMDEVVKTYYATVDGFTDAETKRYVTFERVRVSLSLAVTPTALSFKASGESKQVSLSTNVPADMVSIKVSNGFSYSWSGSGNITVTAPNNTSTTAKSGTLIITAGGEDGLTETVSLSQAAGSVTYTIQPTIAKSVLDAAGDETSVSATYTTIWNGITTSTGSRLTDFTLTSNNSSFKVSGELVSVVNNKTTSTIGPATITVSKSGYTSGTVTVSQAAGKKVYSSWTLNSVTSDTAYNSNTATPASGGSATLTANISRTYTWNGVSGSGGTENATRVPTLSGNTSIVSISSNVVTFASRGTTIGQEIQTEVSATTSDTGNQVKSIVLYQKANYVSKIDSVVCGNLSYVNIGPGATSATATSGANSYVVKYASGSTANSAPSSTYGSLSQTVSYSLGSVKNGFTSVNSSNGTLTATSMGTDVMEARTSGIVTKTYTVIWTPASGKDFGSTGSVSNSASKTATCTQNANAISSYGNPSGLTLKVNDIPASGGTVSSGTISGTASQLVTYTSGATETINPTVTGSYSDAITGSNLGTTIKTRTKLGTLTYTYKANNKSASVSVDVYQVANVVTKVSADSNSFSYNPISAGASSATATSSHGVKFEFTSGSTSTTAPSSSYGSLTTNVTYSLAESKNGFTAVNSSTGALTASARGTTIGEARTSATVTKTLVYTWKHVSNYGGTSVTTGNVTKTATCTQNANYVTAVTPKSSDGTNPHIYYSDCSASGGTITPTYNGSCTLTFSSGSSADATNGSHYGGTVAYSRTYSIPTTTGASINTSSGAVTWGANSSSSSRSVTVTSVLTVTFTHPSGINSGKVVSGTLTATPKCTQNSGSISYSAWSVSISASPTTIGASGGTSTITASASRTYGWNGATSGAGTETSTVTLSGSATGFSLSGTTVTAESRGTTIGTARSITITATCDKDTSKTKTVTITQSANLVTGVTANSNSYGYSNIAAGATSATASSSHSPKYTFSSGSTSATTPASTYGSLGTTVSYSIANTTTNGFTAINSSNGTLTATARGTDIGAARTSATCTKTLKYTWTPTSGYGSAVNSGNLTKTATCTQNANYVRSISVSVGSIAYPTAGAGATSVSLSSNGSNSYTLTYASGSTGKSAPSTTYGSVSTSVSFSLSASQNGFTAVNSSTGALTCTSRGTTTGSARTSGTVTKTYTVKFTPASGYDYGSTGAISKSGTKTATCTQEANVENAYYGDMTASVSWPNKNAGSGSVSPTISNVKCYGYYTSGSRGSQTSALGVSYYSIKSASMTSGNGASINTTTGAITWEAYSGTSNRTSNTATVNLSTKSPYLNKSGSALTCSASNTATQTADAISHYKSATATVTYNNVSAAGGTVSPSITVKATPVYVSGATGSAVTISSSHYSITGVSMTSGNGASINTSNGAITWTANKTTTLGSAAGSRTSNTVTISFRLSSSYSNLTCSDTATASQSADSISSTSISSISASPTTIGAGGGTSTISGGTVTVTYVSGASFNPTPTKTVSAHSKSSSFTGSISGSTVTIPSLAKTELASGTYTVTYSYSGASSKTCTITQSANSKSNVYDTPSISFSYATFAAAGATKKPTMSYSQAWRYSYSSGATTEQTAITSGATVSYSMTAATGFTLNNSSTGYITASNNTSTNARSTKAKVTVTLNSKSNSKEITVSQSKGSYSYSAWSVTISAAPVTIGAGGGNSTITASASRTYGWNGATSGVGTETGTISLSGSATGFTLNGTTSGSTVTAEGHGTTVADARSITITATCQQDTNKTNSVRITQSANSVTAIEAVVLDTGVSSCHWTYANSSSVSAAGATLSPTMNGACKFTFSSGSTSVQSSSGTVFGKSLSFSRSFKEDPAVDWLSVNSSTGVVTVDSRGTTEGDARSAQITSTLTATWGSTSDDLIQSRTVKQVANVRTLSGIYLQPFKPDASWIVDVSGSGSNVTWSTCPASGGYVKMRGYANYTHTSGSALNDQLITGDAAVTWSTGSGYWITNHSNGGYYIHTRGTTEGTARSSTATWSYGGLTSAGKTLTQQANSKSTSYGGWGACGSYGSWSDYDTPYADTTGDYWASCSIGTGLTAAGGSATVTKSAGHTLYKWKRQRRSGTQYRDVTYTYTSGESTTTSNGSSQTCYDYQKVSNGSSSVSDTCNIAITSNGNSRFSLSGTTLSHSTMGTSATTDSVTITATNASSTSATSTCTKSVSNSATLVLVSNGSTSGINDGTLSYSDIGANGSAASASVSSSPVKYSYTSGSSGSAISKSSCSLSYSVNWGGGSSYNNASLNTSTGAISASSLGTTEKARTNVIDVKLTITYGGQSVTSVAYGYQAANAVTGSTYTGYGSCTWGSWTNSGDKYTTKSGYWASCSIGTGLTAAGGRATVTKSAGHTETTYQDQTRTGTKYRTRTDTYTSGSTNNVSESATCSGSQTVTLSTNSASDSCTITITSNGNNRFSLSGTTLSHSSMTTNAVTDSVTIKVTNSSSTSATNTCTASVSNSCGSWGSWTDYGNWSYGTKNYGSWTDTGSTSEDNSNYTASISITTMALGTLGGTVSGSASASHDKQPTKQQTRTVYCTRTRSKSRYKYYTSGSLCDSENGSDSETYYYDNEYQWVNNGSAVGVSDNVKVSNNINSNTSTSTSWSISIGSYSVVGGSRTVTFTATNQSNTSATKSQLIIQSGPKLICSVANSRLTIPQGGGSVKNTVTTNGSVTKVTSSNTAFTVSVTSNVVTVTALRNMGAVPRSATITVTCLKV